MIIFDIFFNCIIANIWYNEQNVTENSSLLAMCVVDMKKDCLG